MTPSCLAYRHRDVMTKLSNSCCIIDKTRKYNGIANIKRSLVGNRIVDHSDVLGAAPALLQQPIHSRPNTWLQWTSGRDEEHSILGTWRLILEVWWHVTNLLCIVTIIFLLATELVTTSFRMYDHMTLPPDYHIANTPPKEHLLLFIIHHVVIVCKHVDCGLG